MKICRPPQSRATIPLRGLVAGGDPRGQQSEPRAGRGQGPALLQEEA
jgi:hypothetical protein